MRALVILSLAARFAFRRVLAGVRNHVGNRGAPSVGRDLADLFERLGPTFIKIGQILSSRPDLISPSVANDLARLQTRVAPFDTRLVRGIIEAEFGRPLDEIFEEFDFHPVSSASVAHVHRAVLRNGRVVAVKILRPGIKKTIEADFRLLEFGAVWLRRVPALRALPMLQAVGEFRQAIEDQLDFRVEADNNRAFRKHFSSQPQIRFPEPVAPLCTGKILTMDFMDAIHPIGSLATDQASAARMILERGLNALYRMIFVDGLVHGDLHPGNIFYDDEGNIVMLDLGLVARLDHKERRDFGVFFLGMVLNRGKRCADVVFETATAHPPDFDRDAFDAAMVALIDKHSGKVAKDFEVSGFVAELFDLQRRMGLTGSTRFMMTIVALLMFEGIAKQVAPDLDFQGLAFPYVSGALLPPE